MKNEVLIWKCLSKGFNPVDISSYTGLSIESILYLQNKIHVYFGYLGIKAKGARLEVEVKKQGLTPELLKEINDLNAEIDKVDAELSDVEYYMQGVN